MTISKPTDMISRQCPGDVVKADERAWVLRRRLGRLPVAGLEGLLVLNSQFGAVKFGLGLDGSICILAELVAGAAGWSPDDQERLWWELGQATAAYHRLPQVNGRTPPEPSLHGFASEVIALLESEGLTPTVHLEGAAVRIGNELVVCSSHGKEVLLKTRIRPMPPHPEARAAVAALLLQVTERLLFAKGCVDEGSGCLCISVPVDRCPAAVQELAAVTAWIREGWDGLMHDQVRTLFLSTLTHNP